MIPNAWVSYKLTRKTVNMGKAKSGSSAQANEDEQAAIDKENMLWFIFICKWMLIIYAVYVVLALISSLIDFIPHFGCSFGLSHEQLQECQRERGIK